MRSETLDLGHFERLYAGRDDPWHFASSPYERAKYAATIAALPRERYGRALDVGCSIGVLTEVLADRCDDLLAIEPVEAALDQARRRNAAKPWVRFGSMFVPGDWPDERFDLIVISEVLDYLGLDDLARLGDRLRGSLAPGGDLVLVHWVGKKGAVATEPEATDMLVEQVADVIAVGRSERNADYRLDLLRRR
jgi:SAM-dependent methyltransferase